MKRARMCVAAGAIALSSIVAMPASAADWYLAHVGAETCVALQNVSPETGQRVYYGAGGMTTPEDAKQLFRNLGATVEDQPSTDGMVEFSVKFSTDRGSTKSVLLFNNKRVCQLMMPLLEK